VSAREKSSQSSNRSKREQDTDSSLAIPQPNYEQENLSVGSERSKKNKLSGGNESIGNKQVPAVAAWREIFRQYQIRSIKQATTPMTNQTTKVQPILIKQTGNEAVGDEFQPAVEGVFRIYHQNVNGVSAKKGTSKWNDINDTMATHNVAIFELAETNIEWNKHRTKAIMQATSRKHFDHSTMMTSTTTMKFEDNYKPGGTCTVITNNWTGRSQQQIEDTTGQRRWSRTIIRGHWFNIAIITAYRVTQSAIEQAGPTTTYAQQWAVSRL
jgi:hypothetical protein